MTPVQDYDAIFADARQVHARAVERLEQDDIRDAAEKAWCATKRATDALILARTGEEPPTTAITSNELDALSRRDPAVKPWSDAITAASANSTGPVSTTASATPKLRAASAKPPTTSATPSGWPPYKRPAKN